jgi:hypothetical protein
MMLCTLYTLYTSYTRRTHATTRGAPPSSLNSVHRGRRKRCPGARTLTGKVRVCVWCGGGVVSSFDRPDGWFRIEEIVILLDSLCTLSPPFLLPLPFFPLSLSLSLSLPHSVSSPPPLAPTLLPLSYPPPPRLPPVSPGTHPAPQKRVSNITAQIKATQLDKLYDGCRDKKAILGVHGDRGKAAGGTPVTSVNPENRLVNKN